MGVYYIPYILSEFPDFIIRLWNLWFTTDVTQYCNTHLYYRRNWAVIKRLWPWRTITRIIGITYSSSHQIELVLGGSGQDEIEKAPLTRAT
jgi:hypothetical protein